MPRFTDRDLAIIRNRMGENIPVPKARKPRSNEESRMQAEVIRWWGCACCIIWGHPVKLLAAIPNGGKRDPIAGKILKREGARSGIPDLVLFAMRHGYGALLIEMKTADGVVSPAQHEYHDMLRLHGYCVAVCRSAEAAIEVITKYLSA